MFISPFSFDPQSVLNNLSNVRPLDHPADACSLPTFVCARLVNITPLSAWTELSPTDISYCLRLKKESEVDIEIVAWNVACLWAIDLLCWHTMKHHFTVFNQQLACNGTSSPPCCILCRLLAFLLSLQLYIVNVLPDIIFAIIFFFHFIRCHLLSSTQPNYHIRFLLSSSLTQPFYNAEEYAM